MNNFDELTDMLQVYFESQKNSYEAVRMYRHRYPERAPPKFQKFARLESNLRMFGSFKKPKRNDRLLKNQNLELDILLSIEENPDTSIREIAAGLGTSYSTVQYILKKHKMRPYIPKKVHALEDGDPPRRLQFCRLFLNKLREDPIFYRRVIWSDECTFTNNGLYNRHNHRHWARENPHITVERNFQRRFSVNVWCGILGDRLVGPFFIDGKLNTEKYHEILMGVQEYLENLPLAEYNLLFFQQDGATPHNAQLNTNFLQQTFGANWIGTNGPVRWPARSPDLTPLDFFFWGYLQDVVYITRSNTVNDLRDRIVNACREISPNVLLQSAMNVSKRCQLCIEKNGMPFEQYL